MIFAAGWKLCFCPDPASDGGEQPFRKTLWKEAGQPFNVPSVDPLADWKTLRGYALCGEPRCGSTYLARLCASTGVLGGPKEYFAGLDRMRSANSDPEGHLRSWVERTSTPNGVYGLKVFADQFHLVRRSRWATRLPNLHFVHIERQDVLGQAISLVRARQTQVFESNHQPRRQPAYSRRSIAAMLQTIALNQARWSCWFARNGIVPLRLTYEGIVSDPGGAVASIADCVRVSTPAPVSPDMGIQRDALSEEWRERFLAESRDLSFLDILSEPLVQRIAMLKARLRV